LFQEISHKSHHFHTWSMHTFLKWNYIYVYIKHTLSSRNLEMNIYVPRGTSLAISIMHVMHNYFTRNLETSYNHNAISIYPFSRNFYEIKIHILFQRKLGHFSHYVLRKIICITIFPQEDILAIFSKDFIPRKWQETSISHRRLTCSLSKRNYLFSLPRKHIK